LRESASTITEYLLRIIRVGTVIYVLFVDAGMHSNYRRTLAGLVSDRRCHAIIVGDKS